MLCFVEQSHKVLISGQALNVAIAKAQMEHLRRALPTMHHHASLTPEVPTNPAVVAHEGSYSHLSVAAASMQTAEGFERSECVDHHVTHHLKDPLKHTLSPGGESNHDSCYDSDNSPLSSRRNSSHMDHSDVSRTTSDTLGTELEKDDVKRAASHELLPTMHLQSSSSNSSSLLDSNAQITNSRSCETVAAVSSGDSTSSSASQYVSKVEFALKLGYTEEQIGAVLDRLGTDVGQNELLGELIKLGHDNETLAHQQKAVVAPRVSGGSGGTGSHDNVTGKKPLLERKSSGGSVLQSSGHVAAMAAATKKQSAAVAAASPQSNLRPIVIDGSNVAMR